MNGRDHITDIAALAASRHVTACSALPMTPKVQSSGRDTPDPPQSSAGASRAQAILGRGYAEGGTARVYALALWIEYGHSETTGPLGLAMALTLTEAERLERVRGWSAWGKGQSANRLATTGVDLIGAAIGWYATASDEPGCSGVFDRVMRDGDAARGSIKRMVLEHETRPARERKAAKLATKGATR